MDIFSIVTLIGGLAFFLYGMNEMSNGLKKLAGGRLEKTLRKMTATPMMGLVLGAGITIAIQSSSAMTVMLVGLVNSGILQLSQTVGVIMGSNIGTTLTAWILSLSGIQSDNIFIKFLKPSNFAPIFALIGIILIMVAKRNRNKDIGNILVGFAILMFGMNLMSGAVEPLADMPQFQSMLTAFKNPVVGVLVGAAFTGIIQSSAASVGILQALSLTGGITYGMAIPIIMGQNIGTCVTAVISSIGVNKNAKRVSVIHMSFNLIGTAVCLILFYGVGAFVEMAFMNSSVDPSGIALAHSIFNIFTTLILLPFSKLLVKIAEKVIPNKQETETYTLIDERLFNTPAIAVYESNNITVKMCKMAHESIELGLDVIGKYNQQTAAKILELEDVIDNYEDKLGTYMVKLSSKELSDADSRQVSKVLHSIGEFERLSDHAVNLLGVAEEMHDKNIKFSDAANKEIAVATAAIKEILNMTTQAFETNDIALACKVEPLEQVIDDLLAEIKARHITRLQAGACTIELGFVLSDLLSNYERVSDHCSNIAVAMIEVQHDSFKTHEYLHEVKSSNDRAFNEDFAFYTKKYTL
ncbi:MAG: Na/Pi cotransporter family protein [Clostridia bacterium]|nr:Na/Pi cotransporter family protein [Clostridia bacterium]